ncbi:UNVERIFIED_CONTAM: hypothetical protein Slati_3068200 [Sesamum latifolium]|uniref:Transposase MuDR plant domain-containing protein n=1 Tax=Sesamum latifolium TaxID=2727402 RepID=A0AAW2UV22_9LAMI
MMKYHLEDSAQLRSWTWLERSQNESSSRGHDSEVAVNEESEEAVRAEVSQGVGDEGIRAEGIQDDRNCIESSDEQSVGDDSCYSDVLVDSEIGSGDEVNDWGVEVNWGGLQGKGKILDVKKSSKGKEVVQHNGFSVFNLNLDKDDPQFEVGLCFPDTQTFRDAVRQHSIVNARDVVFTKNDKNKVQVKCNHESCPWYIFASKIHGEDTMQVKTLKSVHECSRVERVSAANSKWLANKYKDKIRTDPNWPVDSMMSVMQKECKLIFSKFQMYRAKGKVAKMAAGSEDQKYGMLWRYAAEIVRYNPNTTVKIKTTEVEVGIDANNCMYSFAYAVVGKEKQNKQKGLINAVDMLLPHCEHRFCVLHLYNNFKVAHKGLSLKMILWKAAKATRIVELEKILCELRDRDKEAFKWLAKRPAAQWPRAYFRTHSKCDILLNNLCESFNATLVAARSKPIVDMLETIRMMLMKRIYVKRDQMKKHKGICSKHTKNDGRAEEEKHGRHCTLE